MSTRTIALHPLRDLLARLPTLPVTAALEIDYPAADARALVAIRDDADTTIQVINRGLSVVGDLLAHSSPMVEDGTISADAIEALGFFISELSSGSTALMTLAARCRHEVSDWVSPAKGEE